MNGKRLDKNVYYLDFACDKFLAGKELLKSMPMIFNRVYFCKKYADALWHGESDARYRNIALLANEADMNTIRQIVKNNFLYRPDGDSLTYTNNDDYGFSFIAGNILYVIMPYREMEAGYRIKSYDSKTGMCTTTMYETDKQFFLDSSINENGEFVRTCAFNEEDITDENSEKHIAEKKDVMTTAIYDSHGFALAKAEYLILFMILTLILVLIVYMFIKISYVL